MLLLTITQSLHYGRGIVGVLPTFHLHMENRKKLSVAGNEEDSAELAFKDLTDKQNPYFKYTM